MKTKLQNRGRGFAPVRTEADAIAKINAKKGLPQEEADAILAGGFRGSDSAVPPEQPEVDAGEPPAPTPAPIGVDKDGNKTITLKADELKTFVDAAAQKAAQEMTAGQQAQINRILEDSQRAIAAAKDQAAQAQKEADVKAAELHRLNQVFDNLGYPTPTQSNDRTYVPSPFGSIGVMTRSDRPIGAAADFVTMLESNVYTPKADVWSPNEGASYHQKDTREIQRWLRDGNNWKHAMKDMEIWAKGLGLLRGNDATSGSTSSSTIPSAFLDFLSITMRMTHSPRYVFWQFATEQLELGRVPGNNILVPRFAWLDEPTSEADFILDTASSSTVIPADNQALSMTTVAVELKGYGLGKGSSAANRPVSIPEFINAYSMVNLMQALESRLMHNYYGFEDLLIRGKYSSTTNRYYNDNGAATATVTDIATAGDDGTMTEEFLNSVHANLSAANVPTYANGKRVLVTNPFATASLKNSLGDKIQAPSEAQIQEVTNIMNAGTLGDGIQRVQGYYGDYCGFMCFESTAFGVGAAGTEGVNTVAMGGSLGNGTFRSSYVFGPGAVGRGIGMPVEIRMDDSGQFGTKMRFIWRSIEGFGALDVDNAVSGQQDRVWELRTLDLPV